MEKNLRMRMAKEELIRKREENEEEYNRTKEFCQSLDQFVEIKNEQKNLTNDMMWKVMDNFSLNVEDMVPS